MRGPQQRAYFIMCDSLGLKANLNQGSCLHFHCELKSLARGSGVQLIIHYSFLCITENTQGCDLLVGT
jgi:hypothetical protein